jgi:hypothetical protein
MLKWLKAPSKKLPGLWAPSAPAPTTPEAPPAEPAVIDIAYKHQCVKCLLQHKHCDVTFVDSNPHGPSEHGKYFTVPEDCHSSVFYDVDPFTFLQYRGGKVIRIGKAHMLDGADGRLEPGDLAEPGQWERGDAIFHTELQRTEAGVLDACACDGLQGEMLPKELQEMLPDTARLAHTSPSPTPKATLPSLSFAITPGLRKVGNSTWGVQHLTVDAMDEIINTKNETVVEIIKHTLSFAPKAPIPGFCEAVDKFRLLGMVGFQTEEVSVRASGGVEKRPFGVDPLPDILKVVQPTCALVGNSGMLRKHEWGPEIDLHDAVFRFNSILHEDKLEGDVLPYLGQKATFRPHNGLIGKDCSGLPGETILMNPNEIKATQVFKERSLDGAHMFYEEWRDCIVNKGMIPVSQKVLEPISVLWKMIKKTMMDNGYGGNAVPMREVTPSVLLSYAYTLVTLCVVL